MLTIRKAQMEALDAAAVLAFEDRTYAHLQQFFPRHCALLGEARMRRVIQLGWVKSKSYGLTAECCVRCYIEYMCLLGSGFDTDPLMPWAEEILNDRSSPDQVARGDRFYDRAREHIRHLVPDYRAPDGTPVTARFMEELRHLRTERDTPPAPDAQAAFAARLASRLQQAFPAKAALVGDDLLKLTVFQGMAGARSYGLTGERGMTLFTTLRFVLGASFDRDLLMPWASSILNDHHRPQKERVDRLYMKSIGMLRRWWAMAHEAGV